jgi:hypothetical protein
MILQPIKYLSHLIHLKLTNRNSRNKLQQIRIPIVIVTYSINLNPTLPNK